MKKRRVAAVILAGGKGTRMGGNFKQFLRVKQKPVFFFSLEQFLAHPAIQEVIIAVPPQKLNYASSLILRNFSSKKIVIVGGGPTRTLSMFRALRYLRRKETPPDFVVFHDAARPLVLQGMISAVLREAVKHGGAVVGVKSPDLIINANNGFIGGAVDKQLSYCGHTPQCFKFSKIWEAHKKAFQRKSFRTADNIELIKFFYPGSRIKLIDGFYPNLKITYRPDLKMISSLL